MTDESAALLQTIEKLRLEMVTTYLQNSSDLLNPNVLRVSQLLDSQINRYESYKMYHS